MQYTMSRGPFQAMWRPGLADDTQIAAVATLCGPVAAMRVVLPSGRQSCGCGNVDGDVGGEGPALVALDPADPAVPRQQRAGVRRVAPGIAVADTAWGFLVGSSIALVGLDVVVAHVCELGLERSPGPVLLALSDVAVSLGRTGVGHMPSLRTVVVVARGTDSLAPEGWVLEPAGNGRVPVTSGLGGPHERLSAVG